MLYRPFFTTLESRIERQPFVSSRGLVFTWDGRLDNREDLVPKLDAEIASSTTDVAIVAASFERWGTDSLRRLIGDWALAVWDPKEKTLLFARDYAGARNLYYYSSPRRVIWCTYLAPIVQLSGVSFHLSDEYIAGYLALCPETHLTPYQEIQAVPPGHFVTIRDGRVQVRRYWAFDPGRSIRYKTDAAYEEHFRDVFRLSVRRRLRSDSPILADLSGGLDSSSIVCMADDILSNREAEAPRLDTISFYDFTDTQADDFSYFPKIEQKRGRGGHHIDQAKDGASLALAFPDFIAVPGYLKIGNGSGTNYVDTVREGRYRVVLSGVGGDELLGGAPDPRSQLADLIVQFRLPELANQLMAWSLAKRRPWSHLLFQTVVSLLPPSLRSVLGQEGEVPVWIGRQFARKSKLRLRQLGPQEDKAFQVPSQRGSVRSFETVVRQNANLLPPLNCCYEKCFPYLDRTLVEFLISIPDNQLLRPGERRSLMRRALAGLVPAEILARRTKGGAARRYLASLNTSWPELERLFESSIAARLGYLNLSEFQRGLLIAKKGEKRELVRLLRGISLELWLRDLTKRALIYANPRVPASSEIALADSMV